jgi:alkylresorcinol/alkylpyrone synthase
MTEVTQPLPFASPGAGTTTLPRVCGLALSTPPTAYTQEEALALLGLAGDEFAEGVFGRCGVRRRHLDLAPDSVWTTLQARTDDTERRLMALASQAIDELDIDPAEIGVVISATYYSLGGPTLAHRIIDRYGLGADTDKYHLVGIGCASAVPLLRLADQALRDRPGEKALIVAAESVSGFMTAAMPGDTKVKIVGSSLFGDGCAAALLARDDEAPGPAILATAVHQVPDTVDHVRFGVTPADSHMQISRELPAIARDALPGLVDGFLGERGLTAVNIDHWLVHPGGRGIVEGVQAGLELDDEQVASSVHVLAEYGNVGTPASFFVLADTLERHRPGAGDHGLMVTIGPGVTVGLMLLGW